MAASKPPGSAHRDKAGRPVIAVTGMGIVTSLGVGKTDNWAKLTAGESGIRRISRFRNRSRFWPARRQFRNPASVAKGIFPDRCF